MKTNNIKRIRLLYSLFAGILLLCLGLFFFNVISAAEEPISLPNNNKAVHGDYIFAITDLHATSELYNQEHIVEGTDSNMTAIAHVKSYVVDFFPSSNISDNDSRLTCALYLQFFELLSFLVIIVLAIIVLVSFYRSTKQGRIFPTKQTSLLLVIGLLITASSISIDTRNHLEYLVAADLLQGTEWKPVVFFGIHFTRIFFGLTVIFLSQIFRIGREMQEEQELTI
ncbi:MAG: DUF2975 domain-containing protein [Bacteroidales bacterium]|nr:DUF2975 domain-containing protein [Bacteroidales bacterium]